MDTAYLTRWQGKVALVTGASAGIGEACALALAKAGLKVALTARRKEKLDALVKTIVQQGGEALALPTDLSQPTAIKGLFSSLYTAWGPLDVLVNNAGLGWTSPMQECPAPKVAQMIAVNAQGAVLCMQLAVQAMAKQSEAVVVNISSLAGHRVLQNNHTLYAATKHFLRAAGEGLRAELAAAGKPIKICAVSPGRVSTEFHDVASPSGKGSATKGAFGGSLNAQDIAQTVLFMLSVPAHVHINDVLIRPQGQVP